DILLASTDTAYSITIVPPDSGGVGVGWVSPVAGALLPGVRLVPYANVLLAAPLTVCGSPTSGGQTIDFTVVSGALPSGLSIVALTPTSSRLSGIPAVAGNYAFTVRAADGCGNYTDRAFTLKII